PQEVEERGAAEEVQVAGERRWLEGGGEAGQGESPPVAGEPRQALVLEADELGGPPLRPDHPVVGDHHGDEGDQGHRGEPEGAGADRREEEQEEPQGEEGEDGEAGDRVAERDPRQALFLRAETGAALAVDAAGGSTGCYHALTSAESS